MTDREHLNDDDTPIEQRRSLLEEIGVSEHPVAVAPLRRRTLRERVDDADEALRRTLAQNRLAGACIGIGLALMGGGIGAAFVWEAMRPVRAPDAQVDPLADVLGFALLDRDFRRLPVQERLELMLQLADRLRGMNRGDSVVVASFAAGIAGEARKTLEENMRTLGIDMLAEQAQGYAALADEERTQYLDRTAAEWSALLDRLTGRERDISDEERVAEMREQSERDAARARRRDGPLTSENVAGFFQFMQGDINGDAGPNQRAQTARFLRDMTRHLRGRDIATNKPIR